MASLSAGSCLESREAQRGKEMNAFQSEDGGVVCFFMKHSLRSWELEVSLASSGGQGA